MAKLGAVNFAGKSGTAFKFLAYSLDTVFKKHRSAVYVVTRRRQVPATGGFRHRAIGVDQTDDLRQLMVGSAMLFGVPGANCICIYDEKDERVRLEIQNDLRKS